ncbi:MAG TPA: hypothetical protein VLL49_00620 [Anaerolineales bacterium]|nr:hypothetical protein [Anaerolineales bacterium]
MLKTVLAAGVALALLAACAPQPISPEAIAGTYAATLDYDALVAAGAGASATMYKDKRILLEFRPDGLNYWSEVGPLGVVQRQWGPFVLTADEILLQKDQGEGSCSRHSRGYDFTEEGRYNWKLDGDQLTFALISDECEGRTYFLIAQPWIRQP